MVRLRLIRHLLFLLILANGTPLLANKNLGQPILASSRLRREVRRRAAFVWGVKNNPGGLSSRFWQPQSVRAWSVLDAKSGSGRQRGHVRRSLLQLFETPHGTACKQQGGWARPSTRIPIYTSRLPQCTFIDRLGHRAHRACLLFRRNTDFRARLQISRAGPPALVGATARKQISPEAISELEGDAV
jgi:hypothetical protein